MVCVQYHTFPLYLEIVSLPDRTGEDMCVHTRVMFSYINIITRYCNDILSARVNT